LRRGVAEEKTALRLARKIYRARSAEPQSSTTSAALASHHLLRDIYFIAASALVSP